MPIKIICENKKARFNYELDQRFEAGLALLGSEVKSVRNGKANLVDAYGTIRNGEAYLLNCHIASYQPAHHLDHEPTRTRKLLLHKREIRRLIGKTQEKRLTLVPLKMYFKKGLVKVELALGKSKKTIDKRQTIKKRLQDREMRRVIKTVNKR
jgi:SsrA-binding protein